MLYQFMIIDTTTKIRTNDKNVHINFHDLNVLEDGVKFEYLPIISSDSLLVYENKYYLQVYLYNCPYKIVDKQMINYLDNLIPLSLIKISF